MRFGLKKLDGLILKSFIGPFIITFFLVLFILVMQFYWLYMDELLGKGLGVGIMLQLLVYMAASLVPLALPLGVMLASIMTFGGLGEHFELVAMKASGISLSRILRPVAILIIAISIGAFFFNNYVIPVANLKSYSLLYDMRNSKPTTSIAPGIFNKDFDNYLIRIGKKDKDGSSIEDIIIYDHTVGRGNKNVIIANNGKMYPSPSGKYLVFELEDGWRYEESNNPGQNNMTRMHFDKWFMTFDLSKFAFKRTQEEEFKNNEKMMNILQLQSQIDTTIKRQMNNRMSIINNLSPSLSILNDKLKHEKVANYLKEKEPLISYEGNFSSTLRKEKDRTIIDNASSSAKNIQRALSINVNEEKYQSTRIAKFNIEWHNKITLSVACVLLFFIGAPLGGIIRKGGLGIPVLVAILFFLIYYLTSSTGEKLAQEGSVPVWFGLWLSTFVLLPIAVFILNKARNDAAIFSKEFYDKIVRFFKQFKKNKKVSAK